MSNVIQFPEKDDDDADWHRALSGIKLELAKHRDTLATGSQITIMIRAMFEELAFLQYPPDKVAKEAETVIDIIMSMNFGRDWKNKPQ